MADVLSVRDRIDWLARLVPDPSGRLSDGSRRELAEGAGFAVEAVRRLVEQGEAEDAAWSAARLYFYWLYCGQISQGRELMALVLPLSEQASPAARAVLLEVAGTLAFEHGDQQAARTLFASSADQATLARDSATEANALGGLARCELAAGNLDAARAAAAACDAIHLSRGDDEADRDFPLHILAYADYIAGDDNAARAGFHRTLELNRRCGRRPGEARELTNLCSVETRAGNLDLADSLGREALDISAEIGYARLVPYCLINLGGVAAARGQYERAALLLGAGDRLLSADGAQLNPGTALEYRRHRAAVAAALGDEGFARHYEKGSKLTAVEAVEVGRQAPGLGT